MTTYLQPQYGGYSYVSAEDAFDTLSQSLEAKPRDDTPPGVDGDFGDDDLIAARSFTVEGIVTILSPTGVVQTDAAAFQAVIDNLNAVHAPGPSRAFSLNSDRYLNAKVRKVTLPSWRKGLTNIRYSIEFRCPDPFWYAGQLVAGVMTPLTTSANLTSGGASVPSASTAQLADPTVAPTVSAVAAATALGAGTYKVVYTYRDAYGETLASPIGSVTIAGTNKIHVAALALPAGATLANLYMSIAAGSSTLAWVQTWDGTATDITALPASPNSATVTPAGTAYSLPIFSIPVTTAPVGGLVYVIVTGGGKTWTFLLAPQATGTYAVDSTTMQELCSLGGVDVTNETLGPFPRLAAAANTVVVGVSGGAAVGACTVTWQDRWL